MRFWTIFGRPLRSDIFHRGFLLDLAFADEGEVGIVTNALIGFPGRKPLWFAIESVNLQKKVIFDHAKIACPLKSQIRIRKNLFFQSGIDIVHQSVIFPIDLDLTFHPDKIEIQSIQYGIFNQALPWVDFQFLGNSFQKLLRLHPIEVADIIQRLPLKKQAKILYRLDTKFAAYVLSEIDTKKQAPILEKLDTSCAVELLSGMPRNHAANILRDVGEAIKYLNQMDEKIAEEIDRLLSYDPDTVGGLMDSEFIKLNQKNTCQEAIDTLRTLSPSSENIYYLYVVDDEGKFKGVLSSRALLISTPEVKLEHIMRKKLVTIPETIRREEIAHIMSRYHLLALPVVDKQGRIVGVIKIQDVLESTLEYPV